MKGLEELLRNFERLDKAMRGVTAERALIAGALVVQNDAKRKAPYLTGTLRRSIHIGGHTDLAGNFAGKDIGHGKLDGLKTTVLIGTDLEYAARQEFGFSGADSLGRHYHQPPHPYLRPALDTNEDKITHDVSLAAWKLIQEAVRLL